MENDVRKSFEDKIKPLLNYIGAIGALFMSVAYIIVVFVLIKGFKVDKTLNTIVFAAVNAAVGFIIMQFLKYQGECLAKMDKNNKEISDQYYSTKTKDKKLHSMTYYWVTSVVKDIIVKCATVGATSVGVIYIVIKGSNDYRLLSLAIVNLIMFICFGLLSLVKAYDFYNNMHIPYLKEQIKASTVKSEKEQVCLNLETKNSETYKNK